MKYYLCRLHTQNFKIAIEEGKSIPLIFEHFATEEGITASDAYLNFLRKGPAKNAPAISLYSKEIETGIFEIRAEY